MDDEQELRNLGLKVTTPRVKILELLVQSDAQHVSAESVYQTLHEAGDDVGLATIYRVLTQFEAAGLVRRHNFEGGHAVFELDQGRHHDHMVCAKCGRVEEFSDEVIEAQQKEIARQAGFSISDHTLTIFGVCKHCGG